MNLAATPPTRAYCQPLCQTPRRLRAAGHPAAHSSIALPIALLPTLCRPLCRSATALPTALPAVQACTHLRTHHATHATRAPRNLLSPPRIVTRPSHSIPPEPRALIETCSVPGAGR